MDQRAMDGNMHGTPAGIVARLDRLPVSRFHFVLLVIGAASLFFDTLDGLVMTFVLSNLRTVWAIDVAAIGVVSATGFAGYLVGAAACGFIADRIGRKTTILLTLVLYSLVLRGARPGERCGDPGGAALSDIHFHRRREFNRPAVPGGVLAGPGPRQIERRRHGVFRPWDCFLAALGAVHHSEFGLAVGVSADRAIRIAGRRHAFKVTGIAPLVGESGTGRRGGRGGHGN